MATDMWGSGPEETQPWTKCFFQVKIADGYCVLTLNRPARLNALTAELLRVLNAGLTRCGSEETIRAVLLTGAGRAFCAGQDLSGATRARSNGRLSSTNSKRSCFIPLFWR